MCNVVDRPDATYPVTIKPYKLDLTQFGSKVRNMVTFRITNVSDKTLTPEMVAIADRYFKVDLPESIEPGESGEARLKLNESALDQEFEKSFTFELNDPVKSRFTVPVKRKLRPSIQQEISSDTQGGSSD